MVGRLFPKIFQKSLTAAGSSLAKAQESPQLAPLNALLLFGRFRLLDKILAQRNIAEAIGEPSRRGQAVPPGPARLLVVGLEATGKIEVGHKAHVRLIDPHPKGYGSHHQHRLLLEEALLVGRPLFGAEAGVVRPGVKAQIAQPLASLLYIFAA